MEELLRAQIKATAMDAAVALYCCTYGVRCSGSNDMDGEGVDIDWEKLMDIFHEIGVQLGLEEVGIDIG